MNSLFFKMKMVFGSLTVHFWISFRQLGRLNLLETLALTHQNYLVVSDAVLCTNNLDPKSYRNN